MENRTLKQTQEEVDAWVKQFKTPYFSPLSQLSCMVEEVGKLACLLNIMYGDKNKEKDESLIDLEEGLGDLFFSLLCLANSQNIDFTKAYFRKLDKLYTRDQMRFEQKNENPTH